MIPVAYLRSSSLNTWEACEHQYYLEYVLGIKGDSNKAADKGTMVHKVMEVLAVLKKEFQDTGDSYVEVLDDAIGNVSADWDNFIIEEELTNEEVDFINKTRKNKYNYGVHEQKYIHYGHKRLGKEFVAEIIQRAYDYYSTKYERDWKPVDLKDVTNWTWMALDQHEREYDPRLSKIIQPEQNFEIEIDADWANYYYDLPEGELIGKVSLKGTIDLIIENKDGIYEIVDYKGLPIDTPIPTVDGWSTMGELEVGDKVFDAQGEITNIIGKSKEKFLECYEISFDDKTTVTCDEEHLWKLHDGEVVNVLDLKNGDEISNPKFLKTKDKILPIPPYTLGYNISIDDDYCSNMGMYLRASPEDRASLLSGIGGKFNFFSTTCKEIYNQTKELAISLGYRVNEGVENDRMCLKWNMSLTPRIIVNIKPVGKMKTQCIAVDSEDHTFLCTKNMIPTHNTGQRKNWVTGEIKTYEKLQKDTQLLFYNYAIRKLYPEMDDVLLTIYFIRGCNDELGGPATLCFGEKDLKFMEEKLSNTIYDMHTCKQPKLLDRFRRKQFCSFCHFNKTKTKKGRPLCEFFTNKIKDNGIVETTNEFTMSNFTIAKYNAPGE